MSHCHCHPTPPPIPPQLYQPCQDTPVMFYTVFRPASLGDDTETPATDLDYKNVLLVYEANGHAYLYDSNGIPTLITISNFDQLTNRPSYAGEPMTSATNIPEVPTSIDMLSDGNRVSNLETEMEQKQDTLVSGVNIKTLNQESLLGEGDIPFMTAAEFQQAWESA